LVATLIVSMLLVASRVVDGWHWHPGAFVIVGALIFTVGFIYELITRKRDAISYRAAVGIAFVAGFLLTWSNFVQMADVNPAVAMFFGVPIVGIIGAAVARLRPDGMARALFVTAAAQALVIATLMMMLFGRNPVPSWTAPEWRGLCGNAALGMLLVGSAFLFRKAGRMESARSAA
jgi:hypothetical protein